MSIACPLNKKPARPEACAHTLLQSVRGQLSLRVQQLDVMCDTKTKDNVCCATLPTPALPGPSLPPSLVTPPHLQMLWQLTATVARQGA